ncbi:unnamed protein product [Dimorphilus gyrociliatus]|uniref:SRR1-like domain-containing protein n=1 Tax=Dimorphilus gyrociliatus TaxID=2664684 RepID=A0A7I8VF61_9ANNE|nr:unnamed protein product [Dimorphilus gyrociliatus]
MSSVMEKDGFTLVKKGRKHKRKYKPIPADISAQELDELEIKKFLENFTHCLIEMEQSELLHFIKSKYEKNDVEMIEKIECLGLGSITNNKQARSQLALLVQLKLFFNCPVLAYDPIFTEADKIVLSEFNILVDEENTEGMKETTGKTLFFMPHCSKPLVNNILYSNWSRKLLGNVQIFGNSFENMIVRHTFQDMEKYAGYVLLSQKFVKEISIPNNIIIDNVFNDTSLHYFDNIDKLNVSFSKAIQPIYDNDELDFIKK